MEDGLSLSVGAKPFVEVGVGVEAPLVSGAAGVAVGAGVVVLTAGVPFDTGAAAVCWP